MHRLGQRPLALTTTVVASLALLVTACGGGTSADGGSPTPIASSGSSTSTTAPPSTTAITPTPSSTPSATPSPALEDGKHFGFIRSVDPIGPPPSLVLDLAYFLTGEQANQAAKEHGDEYPPPNDYYIVNDNPKLRTLEMSPHVRIRLVDWANCCGTFIDGELAHFAEGFANPDPSGVYRGPTSPYWIWVRDGRVVKIQEQFLP